MNRIRNKKGYSLVEAIIALAVVVIVSATALSICVSAITTKAKAVNRSHAIGFADDVWECFKAAENEVDFLKLVSFAGNKGEENEETFVLNGENGQYTYTSSNNNFMATITVEFKNGERDTLTIEVEETDSRNDIVSFSYKKGDRS